MIYLLTYNYCLIQKTFFIRSLYFWDENHFFYQRIKSVQMMKTHWKSHFWTIYLLLILTFLLFTFIIISQFTIDSKCSFFGNDLNSKFIMIMSNNIIFWSPFFLNLFHITNKCIANFWNSTTEGILLEWIRRWIH